jgi:large subunit ribosomal protein L6
MSRVGKKEIPIPEKTTIDYKNRLLTVKGQKGSLSRTIHPAVDLNIDDGKISVVIETEDRKHVHSRDLPEVLFQIWSPV